mgnify:CR=1 FL=1
MTNDKRIAEFIGIMLGDGSISIYKTHAHKKIKIHRRIKVTLDSRNKGYIKHVSELMKEVLDVEPRINYKKTENAVDIATHRRDKLNYILNELKLKLSPKWNNMVIPKFYFNSYHGKFILKGLFDTDGCLSIFKNNSQVYPRIEIRLCPSPAQGQISKILSDLNFNFKIQKLERGKTRIRISGETELKRWFETIGSSNPIHLEKAKIFL